MSIKNMSKEDLELLSYKDITNLLLDEYGKMNTAQIFQQIVSLLELSNSVFESKIGDFYTSLTTDKRFILLNDGCWDLRHRHASDKLIIEDDEDDEIEEAKDESEDETLREEEFDLEDNEDDYDDGDDELKDLVVIDEDEMELEQ